MPATDVNAQRFFIEYFVETDSEDNDILFHWFRAEDIRRRQVNLIKCRSRTHECFRQPQWSI